ncbi:MAG TPA: hypothetical protein IAB84_03245 [Candidatus Choladousia intestinigallinarum]|nr:hypothetical protein [Candidatus Choladousia intestinigallinarum]
MGDLFYEFLSSRQITFINMVIGAVLFIILLFLFFRKDSRDERGRKIIGKASIAALIVFAACATIISHYMQYAAAGSSDSVDLVINAYLAVNAVQLVFNLTAAVEIIGILILRRKEVTVQTLS